MVIGAPPLVPWIGVRRTMRLVIMSQNSVTNPFFIFLGNSTTSLLTVILCTWIAFDRIRKGRRLRFVMAYVWIAVTGMGSVLFHSTLKYEMQLLDEIPMLFQISHIFFCM